MGIRKSLVAGAAIALFSVLPMSAANAAVVVIQNITATWQNPVGAGVSYQNNGSSNAKVAWGKPSQGGNSFSKKSGYDFAAASSSISTGTFNAPFDSGIFTIGTFTHRNNPITGNALTAIDLVLTAALSINGNPIENYSFTFNFKHNETPNDGRCAYGGSNGQGVNKNGCADRVTVNYNELSDSFLIDGVRYTLDLAGFLSNGSPATSFLSKEKSSNSATIVGKIRALEEVTVGVPEPSTWAMMILGFGFIGGAMRQSRRQKLRVAYA